MANPFETWVARASLIPTQQKGLTKSSKQIAANELRPLDTVLQKKNWFRILNFKSRMFSKKIISQP